MKPMLAPLVDTDVDTDAIQQALRRAAVELRAYYAHEQGELYRVEDLRQALNNWLELSIESLVEDALFHTVEGDRAYAFNRAAFEAQMQRIQPVEEGHHVTHKRAAA